VSEDRKTRRDVLRGAAVAGLAIGLGAGCELRAERSPATRLRPPGALPEREFLARCIRCGRCGTVCVAACIRFDDELGADGSAPYIVPDERACVLCMHCGDVCPTGAIAPIPDDREVVAERVRMGTAQLDGSVCWARGGRGICRACWYACPYADRAIVLLGAFLAPSIDEARCVGCGQCARACPSTPRAISLRPRST
jgi:ferredoxin